MSELSYTNADGFTVFTSKYYRNRGTCCKSNCLHCPYGTTLKNLGLDFSKVDCIDTAKNIAKTKEEQSSLSSSLLGSAFGSKPKIAELEINQSNVDNFKFMFLKEVLCGVVEVSGQAVKSLHLKEEFNDQGLTKEIVSAYL